ncbi:hypothetical protein FACS1894182_10020 [Bacteroidia bacterium]|nr:hypothetical protein FACS1894182_10020 [Bacteroidia bacterium]
MKALFLKYLGPCDVWHSIEYDWIVVQLETRHTRWLLRFVLQQLFNYFLFCHKRLIPLIWNIPWCDIERAPMIICTEWIAEFDEYFCQYIRRCFPHKKLVIWCWNVHESFRYEQFKSVGWEVWSFDKNECEKYGLNYNKTFMAAAYVPIIPLFEKEECLNRQVHFFGRDKGRRKILEKMKQILDNEHIKNKIDIFDSKAEICTYREILQQMQTAILLDVPLENQQGITQREMEALFFGKKLLTTNSAVRERDYYHPNNIHIVDFNEKPETITEFLEKPMVKMADEMIQSYSIEAWLQRFLENDHPENYYEIRRKSILRAVKNILIKSNYIVAETTRWLFPTVKSYFYSDNQRFNDILHQNNFHIAIVKNPSIIFTVPIGGKNRTELITLKLPYINVYARSVIKLFVVSLRRNLIAETIAEKLGIREQYLYNYNLFFESFNHYQEIYIPKNENDFGKIAVYTVNIGNYDKVLDPLVISENCDYFLFTDNPNVETAVWQTVLVNKSKFENDLICSRYYKMLPHKFLDKKYEYSIYLDSKNLICGDVAELVRFVGRGVACNAPTGDETTFAAIRHNARSTITEEAAQCLRRGVIPKEIAERQLADYRAQGFPDNFGLIDCRCLVRKHADSQLQKAMEMWFAEFMKYPYRDQLSVMFSLWKSGFNDVKIIKGNVYNNQFIQQNRKN